MTREPVTGDVVREERTLPEGLDPKSRLLWAVGELCGVLERWLEVPHLELLRMDRRTSDEYVAGPAAVIELGAAVREVVVQADGARLVRCEVWVRGDGDAGSWVGESRARVRAVELVELPVQQLREAVRLGEVAGTFRYRVDTGDVERLAEALGSTRRDQVPTIVFGALDPVERRDLDLDGFLLDLPLARTGGGNAFNEVVYERPIRVGEELTVSTRYTEVYEKPGTRGTLLFRVRENQMRDQDDQVVATSRCGHVLGFRLPSAGETR